MANLSSVLQGIPGLRGWQAQDQLRQEQMQGDQATQLNQMKLAELFNAKNKEMEMQKVLSSLTPEQQADPVFMRGLQIRFDPKAGLEPQKPVEDTPFLKNAKAYQSLVDSGKADTPIATSLKGWLDKESIKESADKSPTTRVIQSGNQKITQEWVNGKWNNVAVGSEKTVAQEFKEAQEAAKAAQLNQEGIDNKKSALEALDAQLRNINQLIDANGNALPGLNAAAGPIGSRTPIIFDDASNAEQTLNSLRSQESMSNMSKHKKLAGQSFGSMQVQEWPRFENLGASFSSALGDKKIAENLVDHRKRLLKMKMDLEAGSVQPTLPSAPNNGSSAISIEDRLKKYPPKKNP